MPSSHAPAPAAPQSPGNKRLPFQLSLSQLISIGPANRNQPLHRDGWGFVLDLQRKIGMEVGGGGPGCDPIPQPFAERAHTQRHAYTHAHTHTHTHTHTHRHTHTRTHARTHAHRHTHTRTRT